MIPVERSQVTIKAHITDFNEHMDVTPPVSDVVTSAIKAKFSVRRPYCPRADTRRQMWYIKHSSASYHVKPVDPDLT